MLGAVFLIWHVVGAFIIFIISVNWHIGREYCWFLNPKVQYDQEGLTWFSSYLRAVTFGFICPIWTLIYWFIKACNIRRIDE